MLSSMRWIRPDGVIRALAAGGALVCLLCATGCDGSADEVQSLTAELRQARQEGDGLALELADANAEIAGLNEQVKELSSSNENLTVEKELLQREARRQNDRINTLNERVRTLNEQLEDLARRTATKPVTAAAVPAPKPRPELSKAIERLDALSRALFDRGDLDVALSVGLTAEELGGESPELLYRIAFCKASARDYGSAADYYSRAWDKLGDEADAALRAKLLTNWGAALAETGDGAGAADLYQQALQIDQTSAAAWFDLGLVYAGDPARRDDAIEAFRNHIIHGGDRGVSARRHIAELQGADDGAAAEGGE
jgi:tetratricopeptide (TPR) repeat protein